MDKSYREILADGLWRNNTGFVQLLGLCPLLAVSNSVINGLGMGLATTVVLAASNGSVSAIRRIVRSEIRIPVFVIIIASLVTAVQLAMSAYFHPLYKVLGIFIPLIVTNCAIIGRAEAFASRNSVPRAVADGVATGLGFTIALVSLGAMRELLGNGTLFDQAQMMFGSLGAHMRIEVFPHYPGFLLALVPPGAFIGLGLLVAAKHVLDKRQAERAAQRTARGVPAQDAA